MVKPCSGKDQQQGMSAMDPHASTVYGEIENVCLTVGRVKATVYLSRLVLKR